jgi:hypothetical protein
LALGKKIIIVKNATAYTWDWYCHLVVDRASLDNSTVTNPLAYLQQIMKLSFVYKTCTI